MIKSFSRRSKWLVALILLTIASLFISGCCLFNEPPVISGLAVLTEGEINPGGVVLLQCYATDSDGDELSYSWSADTGSFNGSGANVNWTAPDEVGTYTINVEVSDGSDDTVTDSIIVGVLVPNNPPVIETISAEWHRLKKGSNTPITCLASDPDGDTLSYEWSAVDGDGNPAGNFTGEGDTVTWFAPNNYGTYTITATVSDSRGGQDSTTIDIVVCACGSAH